ncbi:MAG: hypothetical protein IJX90_09045 [Blautia sp.]|nr:hypothetical protein [Blautia sp.]
MEGKEQEKKVPFSLSPEYDRSRCQGCVCALCYQQEFCDRCSSCEDRSKQRESCYRFEGAYNY